MCMSDPDNLVLQASSTHSTAPFARLLPPVRSAPSNLLFQLPLPLLSPHHPLDPAHARLHLGRRVRRRQQARLVPRPQRRLAARPQLRHLGLLRALRRLDAAHALRQRHQRRALGRVRHRRVLHGGERGHGRGKGRRGRQHDGADGVDGQLRGRLGRGGGLEEVGACFI